MLGEAWTAVKNNGRLLSIAQPIEGSKPATGVSEGVEATFFIVSMLGERLQRLSTLIEEGYVKSVVDSVYPWDDFQKAFDYVETGRAKGKIVLRVLDPAD